MYLVRYAGHAHVSFQFQRERWNTRREYSPVELMQEDDIFGHGKFRFLLITAGAGHVLWCRRTWRQLALILEWMLTVCVCVSISTSSIPCTDYDLFTHCDLQSLYKPIYPTRFKVLRVYSLVDCVTHAVITLDVVHCPWLLRSGLFVFFTVSSVQDSNLFGSDVVTILVAFSLFPRRFMWFHQ